MNTAVQTAPIESYRLNDTTTKRGNIILRNAFL